MSLRTVLVVEPSKAASRDTDGKQVSSVLPCLASAAYTVFAAIETSGSNSSHSGTIANFGPL
jgi:hypothetical protein